MRERGVRHILSSLIALVPFVSSFFLLPPLLLAPFPLPLRADAEVLDAFFSVPGLLLAFNQQDTISGLFLYAAWCFAASYTSHHLPPRFSQSFINAVFTAALQGVSLGVLEF